MTFNTPYIPHCPVPPLSLAATQNTLINQNRQLSWTEILINRWQSHHPTIPPDRLQGGSLFIQSQGFVWKLNESIKISSSVFLIVLILVFKTQPILDNYRRRLKQNPLINHGNNFVYSFRPSNFTIILIDFSYLRFQYLKNWSDLSSLSVNDTLACNSGRLLSAKNVESCHLNWNINPY